MRVLGIAAGAGLVLAGFMVAASPGGSSSPRKTTAGTAGARADTAAVRAMLGKVSDGYRKLESFHFEGTITLEYRGQGRNQTFEIPVLFAGIRPNRVRAQNRSSIMATTHVSDGHDDWIYAPQLGQYTRTPTAASGGAAGFTGAAASATPLVQYQDLTHDLVAARLLREERVDRPSLKADCYVIEATYRGSEEGQAVFGPVELWIDKDRLVVVRENRTMSSRSPQGGDSIQVKQGTVYDLVRVNESLPDSLFTFTPPEGAKEVPALGQQNPSQGQGEGAGPGAGQDSQEWSGKKAEDFTLTNLAGKPRRLSSYQGKVVLLDFWATWCGPCRMEMPILAKLSKQYKAKGLVVLGVNVGETAAKASAFMKKNQLGFDSLLDLDTEVSTRYGAVAIPTVVVIDRTGTIAAHFIGLRDEDTLIEALKKAGLK